MYVMSQSLLSHWRIDTISPSAPTWCSLASVSGVSLRGSVWAAIVVLHTCPKVINGEIRECRFSILQNWSSITYLLSFSQKKWPFKKDSRSSKNVNYSRFHIPINRLSPPSRSILKNQLISSANMTVISSL